MILVFGTVSLFALMGVAYSYATKDQFQTVDAYLTARNALATGPAAATTLASIMGAWILFSPAEAGTWGGITAFGGYAVAQAAVIALYAVLGPRLRRLAPQGSTLPEYVYYRYGKAMYLVVLTVSIFYMAVFLAAELTGIALAVNLVAGVPLWLTALAVGGGTLVYAAYGGIRSSIFTDGIQTAVIIPTLILAFAGTLSALGGAGSVVTLVRQADPTLLSFGHRGGWEFTATLLISVIAANLFHQGFWSRVYACRDDAAVRNSFTLAGLLVVPVMVLAGSFGLFAVAGGYLTSPSSAMFEVILAVAPAWVINTVLVLAVALVMSSADTLINAIAGTFTVDIARFRKDIDAGRLLFYARLLTGLVCAGVVAVAARGYSVLYLFFIADLVCSAAAFPTVYGLYGRRFSGGSAVAATLVGVAAGALLFPDPAFTRGNLLYSFAAAFFIPVLLTLLLSRRGEEVDLEKLGERIHDVRM
ncbi:MAG: sodium:solute symporter family transporter [bacterium]|jgi:Na+/proline symporter